jgi:hypothetical protein
VRVINGYWQQNANGQGKRHLASYPLVGGGGWRQPVGSGGNSQGINDSGPDVSSCRRETALTSSPHLQRMPLLSSLLWLRQARSPSNHGGCCTHPPLVSAEGYGQEFQRCADNFLDKTIREGMLSLFPWLTSSTARQTRAGAIRMEHGGRDDLILSAIQAK